MGHLLQTPWNWINRYAVSRVFLLSLLIGVVAGFGAIAFNIAQDAAAKLMLERAAGFSPPQPHGERASNESAGHGPASRWVLLLMPALGGLLAGIIVYTFAPEAEGHGTDAMIDSFHRKGGHIRGRVPLIKTIASALTIGSGGSAGREGPIAQIGAGFGSAMAGWLKAGDRERRTLLLAGAGAGIGAVFRAPLGGALFAVEVLYREIEFESSALIPTFIASITAYSVYCGINGTWGAIFSVPVLPFRHPIELALYALLGLVCAGMGTLYVRTFYGIRDRIFRPMRIPPHFKPAIGGLCLGIMAFFLPEVLGMGYGYVQQAIDGALPLKMIVLIAFAKILGTGFTISSGGSGGVFAPSIVIGGMTGAMVGLLAQDLMPETITHPSAFVLVGMAGFFSGVAKAPVASLIMVSEMTVGYGLLVPLMLATAVAYLVLPRRISIYENQVNARTDSPAHEGEFVVDVLETMKVKTALATDAELVTFKRATSLQAILDAVAASKQLVFPVLNDDDTLYGVIYFNDIRLFFTEHEFPLEATIAQDLIAPSVSVVTLDEDLSSALKKFRTTRYEELPVIDLDEGKKVVGVLSRRDVITMYHDHIEQAKRS